MASFVPMRACPQCGTACEASHQYCPACGFPIGAVAVNSEDKLVGRTLPGGYLVLDLISVGGMGRVYRAEQRALGRTVAVKVIHPHLLSDENSIVRFMTEARAASQLNHPNSVSVIDFGRTDDGQPYLVMEFLRGKDLARVAYEQGPLPFKRIVDVLSQALMALSEAHDLGIVHRDLKPENIILEPLRRGGDFVKVVDFGLAKLKADQPNATNVTLPGIVCGTPDYMAPEQGRGDPIDGRSDLYAVGVILFQLMTGRLPFEADNPTQVVMMHLSVPIPDPRQVAPERNIPEPLVRVVMKAMSKDAKDRYSDALEFADALQQALDEARSQPPAMSQPLFSQRPGQTVECRVCASVVPMTRFCCECGARLPVKSETPTPPPIPDLPLPFVGRDDDLAWLGDRRREAAETIVGARIVGEHGVGKTRLIKEFLEIGGRRGDHVVVTGPDPYGAEVAYHAVRKAITGLVQLDSGGGARRPWDGASPTARRGLDEIYAGMPSRDDPRTPHERRRDLADALRWAVQRAVRVAAPHSVVLAIDDLQRVDGSSRSAFADMLGEPPSGGGLLVIGTHTPGFDAGWGAKHAARVVSGLPPPIVTRLLKNNRPSERMMALAESGLRGIPPLYVEQVLRFAMEGGTDPPLRLADLISHRMATLEPRARRVLQALGVLGDGIEPEAIAEVLGRPDGVQETLGELVKAGMVEMEGRFCSLSHPLIREIVVGAIPAEVRRELHARAVSVYEKRDAPIEVRAMHAYDAQDTLEALLLLEQVAERALARDDVSAAIDSLRRALDLARQDVYRGELDDPLKAVAIFARKLGDALIRGGAYSDADGVLREALHVAGPIGAERAHLLASLARVAHGRERADEAFGYIDEAIDVARKSGSHELLASLTSTRRTWVS
ncbi:MAG TPA: protein kinase [Polyangiaceae bacterium]|jgi:serine/threonine-protein kinase|nr:protein kinase [Polyangiaceae bacterium]